jgi:signal transduction histidine kinase/ligand-binding sensor domain-containing protein/DNA-binding response OmpR family regulator
MKTKVLCVVCLLLLLSVSGPACAGDAYRFRTFSPKGGFYYDGVQRVLQDDEGFIWILLENDLQRFDGYEYKRYSSAFRNVDSPDTWNFRDMAKDASGRIYVATNNGLFSYDRRSDGFAKVIGGDMASVMIGGGDRVWCMVRNRLCYLDPEGGELVECSYNDRPVSNVGYFTKGEGDVYFASYFNRIYHCKPDDPGAITLFHLLPVTYEIAGIAKAGDDLWVLTRKHGVVRLDIATGDVEKQFSFREQGDNIPLHAFHVDKNSRVWIGTQRGLYVLDPETGGHRLYRHAQADRFSLPNNSVWVIAEDSHRNLWIGTYAGGLCYVNLDEELSFRTYTPSESPLNHNLVSSFAEEGDLLWIGTEGEGLNCLDRRTGVFTYFKHDGRTTNSLSYNNVKSLALDTRGRLWISMYRGGLDCMDTRTKRFRHFRHDAKDGESIYSNDLRKIILDGDSGLWIAYQTKRLLISYFSFHSERFSHYAFDEDAYVFDMEKDHRGNLWIITHERLYRMDIARRTIEKVPAGETESLNAQSLCVGASGIWIGTIGKGLMKYDPATARFESFGDILHFNLSTIYSMCADDAGSLWLGTDNGLFRYDVAGNSYLRFDESDGFQGQIYYPLAALKSTTTGELYFGGTNGFTVIDPRNIKPNSLKPQVIISDFYIDNRPVAPTYGKGTAKDEILLGHNQTHFGFKFSSDNYLSPSKNRFRYRLKGYDDRWIISDAANRTAMYAKVPPGTFTFEIATANNDGLWGDTTASIKIRRRAAPWASLPAYMFYSLLIISMVGMVLHHYHEKRKLKLQLYIDNLDKQKQEEIHQSQLRFFTNVSHDFRTPLSLILATVDNLRQEGLKDYYYRILHSNAQRLLNLVNELLDFRTLENGKRQLHVQPLPVNRLIAELSADFKDYARKRNIDFTTHCDPKLPETLFADRQVVEKVVMNLLNNAFKYTNDGGRITIETHATPMTFTSSHAHSYRIPQGPIPTGTFLLLVRDTGIGIADTAIGHVFERYYKANSPRTGQDVGTGIGLALVKSLVLLHKGAIALFSETGKGTDIAVYLPTDETVYLPTERADADPPPASPPPPDEPIAEPDPTAGTGEPVLRRRKKKILIVEDNRDLRTLLANFLSRHYEIREASDGVHASEILEKNAVDLILSDIMMPAKDGVTFCREVKADLNTSHIPVILLTAKTELEAKLEGAGSGADLYFEKPVDLHLLLLSIGNLFRHQQSLREYYARNYYADSAELTANERDHAFLEKLIGIVDRNLDHPNVDVNRIAAELSMSRSKLYTKVKMLTGRSIVEFALNCKLRRAARLIIEQDIPMSQVMDRIGIRSQSYFVHAFKKEFGQTPSAFAATHRGTDKTKTK